MIPLPRFLIATVLLSVSAWASDVGWKPMWNGKTLEGWHPIGKGEWKVEDGMIVGRHAKDEKEYTHLVTDAVYGDFSARFKFKSVAGNSGFYLRIDEDPKAFSGVKGFQAEIDPQKDVGGLYETNGRSWVVQPTPEQVKSYFKPGDWNEMTVSAHGTKIVVTVNGQKTAEIDDPKGRKQGHIALQLHAGQEGLVYFKDLQIEGEPLKP
ncbi:3-keto-disaccharide hydrolase [Verrucomicrobiota bacterium sgz303538]